MSLRFVYLACLLCIPTVSSAESTFEAGFTTLLQHFDYSEFNRSDENLNTESGLLPGVAVFVRHSTEALSQQFMLSMLAGEVDYDGQTQSGSPHQTETSTKLFRASYRLSATRLSTYVHPFFSLNWDQWSRSIQARYPVIGLDEDYRWPSLDIGLSFPLIKQQGHELAFSAAFIKIFSGKFGVDLTELGYGSPSLDLGSGKGFESTIDYIYTLQDRTRVGFSLFYRQWEFAESEPKTISNGSSSLTFLEPRSESQRIGLALVLSLPLSLN